MFIIANLMLFIIKNDCSVMVQALTGLDCANNPSEGPSFSSDYSLVAPFERSQRRQLLSTRISVPLINGKQNCRY